MSVAAIFERFPRPPCADLLGWHILDARPEIGWIRIGFEGRDAFRNPAGFIQGGLLTAMLDDTMGPAVLAMSGGALYTVTLDLQVSFLNPARPGRLYGEGQVIQLGKTVGFLEGKLFEEGGALLATAKATVRLIPAAKLGAPEAEKPQS